MEGVVTRPSRCMIATASAVVALALVGCGPSVPRFHSEIALAPSAQLRDLRKAMAGGAADDAAAKALGNLGDPKAVRHLEAAFERDPKNTWVLAALAWLGQPSYVELARTRVREATGHTFTMLSIGLARTASPELIDRLERIVDGRSDGNVLWAAVALADAGRRTGLVVLESALRAGGRQGVVAAAALVRIEHPDARPALLEALQGHNESAWDNAAVGLGMAPHASDLPALEAAWSSAKNAYARIWLAWAILRTRATRP